MPFKIERNDITNVHTEAIVNTANPKPIIGTGTDTAIYHAAGMEQMLEARQKIGEIKRGEAAYTQSFNLAANGIRYIIHTVGVRWEGGEQGEIDVMRNCYRNSLRLAEELNCKSISIPLLATGNYEFPKETALNIALDEISHFLFTSEMEVVLIVYDKESFQVSKKIFDGVKSFINDNYIADKSGGKSDEKSGQETKKHDEGKIVPAVKDFISRTKDTPNFQDLLRTYIREKNLDNPTVYKRSLIIDKKLFSKIISGHIPNKRSAMALGLALELELDEYEKFLATANFALNPSNMFDTVVKYCVLQKIYDLMKIDSILFQMDLPCFNE
ncbi:MAG: macro domain-containing protein [Treponema sp.]|nr:macro domain-containing protein [Treponema sp.]